MKGLSYWLRQDKGGFLLAEAVYSAIHKVVVHCSQKGASWNTGVGSTSCHVGHQVTDRCCTRGEYKGTYIYNIWLCQVQMKLQTLALQPRRDVTKSPKQEYQWHHKKNLFPPKNLFKKTISLRPGCASTDLIWVVFLERLDTNCVFYISRLIRQTEQKLFSKNLDQIACLAVSYSSHYTRMFSVLVLGCNWMLFMHGWFCQPLWPLH